MVELLEEQCSPDTSQRLAKRRNRKSNPEKREPQSKLIGNEGERDAHQRKEENTPRWWTAEHPAAGWQAVAASITKPR